MIAVQFFAQDKTSKQKTSSNKLYFDEINFTNLMVLKAQRTRLETNLPNYRILCVIEQLEEESNDDNTDSNI
jgi:hypothetical protein